LKQNKLVPAISTNSVNALIILVHDIQLELNFEHEKILQKKEHSLTNTSLK